MTFTSVLLTILWIVAVPAFAGSVFTLSNRGFIAEGIREEGGGRQLIGIFMWSWFLGQLLLWCSFQIIAVWEIINKNRFPGIVRKYSVAVAVFGVLALAVNVFRYVRKKGLILSLKNAKNSGEGGSGMVNAAWVVFTVLLVIQIVLQVVLAYMDVDDSFYVSEAVSISSSDKMYNLIPYTGQTTEMDFRHSLEPFPAWIAYVSKITGCNVTSMAHVMLPALLLPLTYGTYALMGSRILGDKKKNLPVYLIVMELLVAFGLYSSKSPEKFFLTRIRQGKSALASLIIPGIILCLFMILDYA